MSGHFRIVHFIPHHASSVRIPLGALLVTDTESPRMIAAAHLPGPDCLGGRAASIAARMIIESLADTESFDELPVAAGPHAVLDKARPIPQGVQDPVEWITGNILPVRPVETLAKTTKSARRATLGFQFFANFRLERYVRKTFEPRTDWTGIVSPAAAKSLPDISLWSGDPKTELLLMEPIIVGQRKRLQDQLKDVGMRLGAYRHQILKNPAAQTTTLIAYVLEGGDAMRRSEIVDAMHESAAHLVVDVERDDERQDFIDRVKHAGSSLSQGTIVS